MPERENFSLVSVEASVSTLGEQGVSDLGPAIKLTSATNLTSYDYYLDGGDAHLYGRLERHAQFRLSKGASKLIVPMSTVNDDFTVAFTIVCVISQYDFKAREEAPSCIGPTEE